MWNNGEREREGGRERVREGGKERGGEGEIEIEILTSYAEAVDGDLYGR